MFTYVVRHFESFLQELELSPKERVDAVEKAGRIAKSLFAAYYPGLEFDPACFAIVGSFGKGTAARPRTDIDMIFVLPLTEWSRFERIAGNKQSYLLQDVKAVLLDTFPSTDIKGDGPVVKVPFGTYNVEVVPVFKYDSALFLTPHTKHGGYWGYTNPAAERQWLNNINTASSGKAIHLVRMLKAWKSECNVDLPSACLEILALCFLTNWPNREKPMVYYDLMVRDFFAYLLQYVNGWTRPAGIDEWIPLGNTWASKAQSAYDRACKAYDYESGDQEYAAAMEWQKIFGSQFRAQFDIGRIIAELAAARR